LNHPFQFEEDPDGKTESFPIINECKFSNQRGWGAIKIEIVMGPRMLIVNDN